MADTEQVLNLAAIIRKVDGNHSKGAAALAESILDHPRFRAALADEPAAGEPASVIGEPSDKRPTAMEIIELSSEIEAAGLGQVDFARAVLARWGNKVPAPLANGEVGELIGKLVEVAPALAEMGWDQHAQRILRTAELLQREVLVPVSASERLPGPEDCDAEGRCWFLRFPFDYSRESWSLEDRTYGCNTGFTHWLPAHALPLPSGEVGQ